jgi:hypothetical protein
MGLARAKCSLRVEELEQRDAPATLGVTPRSPQPPPAAPITATIADQGFSHGVDAHATAASGGTVA